ncbi:MAG: transcriptional regulator [Bacteroidetes bacterium RIFCSPLOWO2_12_FULL_35_15]|nr:MAG: transcriptional regulator [Bacteroidetes bacterium RIFCSPLOWO2_12_FULL_35_15]
MSAMEKIKNLALIDDDDTFVFLTKKVIEQTNLVEQIKVFANGRDAINFLKENSGKPDLLPEIILLDLNMPIMDGWQFLEDYIHLKPKMGKKITIYIISSSISPHDIERAKGISEVSDFIIKPVTKEKFISMLNQL